MRTLNLRRIFIIAGIVSLLASYTGIWIRMINDPVERTGSDFIHFYSAGRIAQRHGTAHVYNLALQHEFEEEQVGFRFSQQQVLPYNHLPFLIPILQITVGADYVSSFYRWVLIMMLIYVVGITLFGHIFKQARIEQGSVLIAAMGSLLFLPFFFSLMNGQDTAFLFLGTAVWVYGLISGKQMISGVGLSLTTVRPHIALILSLPMLFYNRKVFLGFILGSGILAMVSFLILGTQGTREFIDILLLSATGEGYGVKPEAMFNMIGLLTRILPGLTTDTIRLIGWIVYGITIIGLCILWGKNKNLQNGRIGLTVTLALFVAPHLNFHDLTLLLIPIYEIMRTSRETGILKTPIAIVLPIAISLLLLISNISPYLQYTTPYLLMLALALYPFYQNFKLPFTKLHQS
jgi:glycosyl transferase family 87